MEVPGIKATWEEIKAWAMETAKKMKPSNKPLEGYENVDMVELVGKHTKLIKRDDRYWGCCPFHEEATPSFMVSDITKTFYCFGCHKGGGPANFLMAAEGIGWKEANERLGVKIRKI